MQNNLSQQIEAILFYLAEPVEVKFLVKTLDVSKEEILTATEDLAKSLAERGLKLIKNGEELIDKSIKCFKGLSPYIGERLEIMKVNGFFDVDSRKGKAPGGYNYPLAESGAPFIFMNSAGTFRDLTTMVHEG